MYAFAINSPLSYFKTLLLVCIDWSIETWLSVALVPAALYAIQNIAALTAYQNLDALTFNVLNQTKTLSAAICLYFVMGRRQSVLQAVSLMMLLVSALVMEGIIRADVALSLAKLDLKTVRKLLAEIEDEEDAGDDDDDGDSDSSSWDARHFTHGVCPIMLASFISGLAGALSQKNLQQMGRSGVSGGRNPYLFSMELCLASTLVLLLSLLVSSDGKAIVEHGFWKDWTPQTLIPIATNSVGGILVGLVTKYAGSVRKGFALILGIFLSGVLQAMLQSEKGVRPEQVVGGLLAAIALYIHATNPPRSTGTTPASTPAASPSKPVKQD